MKSLSHMGRSQNFEETSFEIFRNGRGKQFSKYRERVFDDVAKKWLLILQSHEGLRKRRIQRFLRKGCRSRGEGEE